VKARRGPWLSGLIVALAATVWMVGQVIGGLVTMASDFVSNPAGPLPAAGTVSFAGPNSPEEVEPLCVSCFHSLQTLKVKGCGSARIDPRDRAARVEIRRGQLGLVAISPRGREARSSRRPPRPLGGAIGGSPVLPIGLVVAVRAGVAGSPDHSWDHCRQKPCPACELQSSDATEATRWVVARAS